MPAGAPTKYNDSMLKTAENYYAECVSIINQFPSVEELSRRMGIDDDTLVEWSKQEGKEKLSAAIKRLKSLQRERLQGQALFNKVNPTMAIFLLKANHGFIDTSRQEISGRDGGPIETATLTYMPKQLKEDYFEQPASDQTA